MNVPPLPRTARLDQIEGLRGKEALVQAVVKNIARKEDKPPETRSDDELRTLLRAKGEQTMQVIIVGRVVADSQGEGCGLNRFEDAQTAKYEQKNGPILETDSGTEN